MRKLILFLLILTGIQFVVRAQCTPDPAIGGAMMYPEKLANAMAGYYYYQPITFRVPADTIIDNNGNPVTATIDSMRVVYISGIPAGYSYACNNLSCTWSGGTLGCALLQGTTDKADTAMVGEYPLKFYVQTWGKVGGAIPISRIDSSSGYIFKIVDYNGLFELNKLIPLTVFPNPSEGSFRIELRDIQSQHNLLQVMDAQGKIVYEKAFGKPEHFLTTEQVILGDDSKGLYLVRLYAGDQVLQQKVLVR